MSEPTKVNIQVSLPICTILFVVFLILKLTSVIDWSWWWVTSPIWLPTAAVISFMALLFVALMVVELANYIVKLLSRKK